jgi:hypothetical protein
MEFAKLNFDGDFGQEYTPFKIISSFGKKFNEGFQGISYSMVLSKDKEKLFSVIPEKYRRHFVLTLMRINSFIPPHIDHEIKSAINFYVQTVNCVTQFYEEDHAARIDSAGVVFDANKMVKTNHFCAKDLDAYLLDVTKPHAVWDVGGKSQEKQNDVIPLFADAKVDDEFDLAKKDNSPTPTIRDKYGNIIDYVSYEDIIPNMMRIAFCVQSRDCSYDDVKEMLVQTGHLNS